jgi:GcvH upstream region-like protein
MLQFLRKHQRYFFAVITFVIIISFSFFGTFNAIDTNPPHEQVVFKAVNGDSVKRIELDEMTQFISSDAQDKLIMGGIWGPNFLNDGVIRKNFIETGMGLILGLNYPEELLKDLEPRFEKERRFKLYSNPKAPFINVESAWSYFAPGMKYQYDLLRNGTNPVDAETLAARFSLFLQEKQFPAPLLNQILHYQEKQSSWVPADPNLDYYDLALFGYHSMDDWFGPRFVRLVAQFIINSAKIAESKGYAVSKEEALADLMNQSAISYQQNSNNPNLGVANQQQYFDEQLRRMNMDKNKAVKIWRDILLFRRLYNDVGNAIVVDPLSIEKIQGFAKEGVQGNLYELPGDLRFNSYKQMQRFETYLSAITKRNQEDVLNMPAAFLSVDEVAKKYPELVQHRYILDVATVTKNSLQTRVGVKETWDWEVDAKNWETLKNKFPELGIKKGATRDERFASLDSLDEKTRSQVDAFARSAIVDLHPEWIDQALDKAQLKSQEIALLEKGGKMPFAGEKRQEVIQLLDKASLKGEKQNEAAQKLARYSPDNSNYYRIVLVKKAPQREIITFAEAEKQEVLQGLLDKELEAHYVKMRETDSQFKKLDGSWKPLADVSDLVADQYFAKLKSAIEKDYTKAIAPQKPPALFLGDYLASLRFYSYMRQLKSNLEKDSKTADQWIANEVAVTTPGEISNRAKLEDQWKLVKTSYKGSRSDINTSLNADELFALKENNWSKVNTPVNGDVNFFFKEKYSSEDDPAAFQKISQMHAIASADAQRIYMQKMLDQLKSKNALSLDFMNTSEN